MRDDEIQSRLRRKYEEFVRPMEYILGKQIREVKISPDGGLTTIINDGRYMHESPVFLEDPAMVAELQNS